MYHPLSDSIFQDHESLAMATSSSIVGRSAFGPNAGQKVTRIGSGFDYYEEIPLAKGHRCFSVNGFSLHANTAPNTLARDSLRKLVEYISRGLLSNGRLEITKSGLVKLKLKTAYSDGTSHLLFTPWGFYRKTKCHHSSSNIPSGQMERGICTKLTLPQKSSSKARREKGKITQK